MAVSVSIVGTTVKGNKLTKIVDITFDSSYPTGGEALTPATLGFVTLDRFAAAPAAGYVFQYDFTNNKLKAFWVDTTTDGAPLAEVVDTTDIATVVTRAEVEGF